MRLCTLGDISGRQNAIIVCCDTFRSHSHNSVFNRRAPEVITFSSEKTEDSQPLSRSTTGGTTSTRTVSFTPRENNISLAPEGSNILELSMKEYHDEVDILCRTRNPSVENKVMMRAKVDKSAEKMFDELAWYSPDWKVQEKERKMYTKFRKYQGQWCAYKKYGSTFEEFKAKYDG